MLSKSSLIVGIMAMVGIYFPAIVVPPKSTTSISTSRVDQSYIDGIIDMKTRAHKCWRNKSKPKPRRHWMKFIATWYSYEGGSGNHSITATGAPVKDGVTVAVDPRVIPLNSEILVKFPDGHTHPYKAEDTGGAIKGAHIDIFDSNRTQCIDNGVQNVGVIILHKG